MKILRLIASSSVAASMTRSASPTACRSDATWMRFRAACISASVMMPRETWRAMLRSMVERALSTASFFRSLRATS